MQIKHFIIVFLYISSSSLMGQGIPKSNKDSLYNYINFFGQDSLKGRATGSDGLKTAAKYIVKKLNNWHFRKAGENNTYLQRIPFHSSQPSENSTLQLAFSNQTIYLLLNKQFLLIKSGMQTFIPVPVKVVFVGYGIDAPEYDYNDYRDVDVAGKIVVLLEGEPYSDTDPTFFSGKFKTLYSIPESKIRTAFAKGAIGTILIPSNQSDTTATWIKRQMAYSFEDVSLPQSSISHLGVFLNRESAGLLFNLSKQTYAQVLAREKVGSLTSFELDVKIAFTGTFKQREFKSSNIIAFLPGSDPQLKNEAVIIGAHYDHLGIGKAVKEDSIYNGVLDNAVGSAVVLEIARMFSISGLSPRRSMFFIFFTAEEKGLLGSEYYTQHPAWPLNKTIAMVNVDGVAAIGKFKSLIGIGASYSNLANILQETASEHGYLIEQLDDKYLEHLYARSDQFSFARKGVPSILITEGFEYESIKRAKVIAQSIKWFNEIYHSPFDDLNQTIDYSAIQNYTDFLFAFCNRLLNISQKVEWCGEAPFKTIRLQTKTRDED